MKKLILLLIAVVAFLPGCGKKKDTADGGSVASYCDLANKFDEASNQLDEVDFSDPTKLQAAFEEVRTNIEDVRSLIPDEIADDFAVAEEAFLGFIDALEAADWDVSKIDPGLAQEFSSADVQAATDAMNAYNEANC